MNPVFAIKRVSSPLREETWDFNYIDNGQIVVNRYEVHERASLRHKFKVVSYYNRYNERDCDIKSDKVPMPEDVVAEALGTFVRTLRVHTRYHRG